MLFREKIKGNIKTRKLNEKINELAETKQFS